MAGVLLWCSSASLAQDAVPEAKHIGVGGCSASTCHGAATDDKKKRYIFQDEYQTWKRLDKHAKAYDSLLIPLGKRIAANLGIGAAEKSQLCLSCHTDNVSKAAQDKFFHVEDGVGCEACHGAAEHWLAPHIGPNVGDTDTLCPSTPDHVADDEKEHKSHASLAAYGLYPTDKPLERAELCLNCHLGVIGDENKFVTHRLMGAGHPRMPFELQTFSQRQPAHFRIDCKYRARKEAYQGVKFWAIGQAMALARLASSVDDPKRQGTGRFPELVLFDCGACHHSIKELRWQKREDFSMPDPGLPHLNDANAVMLLLLPAKVAPDLKQKLDENVRALHRAMSVGKGDPVGPANAVAETAKELAKRFDSHVFTPEEMTEMLRGLGKTGEGADAGDYAVAEQVTWAIASIVDTLCQNAPHSDKQDEDCKTGGARDGAPQDHKITREQYIRLSAAVNQCYDALLKEETYDPANFERAAQSVLQAVPAW